MRTTLIAAVGFALALAGPAYAQAPAEQPAQAQKSGESKVRSLSIVDISELPPETQAKVNDIAAKASEADLKKLHTSIDASPQVKEALAAKGLKSSNVIAANLDPQGALTLVTKKTT